MAPNTELLIEIVQKFPVIYDTTHGDYKNNRIKNRILDNIAKILGESDGDTLKKQWKNLRDAYSKHLRSSKTSTGQAAKVIERYKSWPWATLMSFLRPHLEFSATQSNIQKSADDASQLSNIIQRSADDASQLSNISPINTAADLQPPLSQSQQKITPQHVHSRRKRSSVNQSQSEVDRKRTETDDDTDLLFKSYAKKLKKMTNRRQATVKFEIAKIMLKAELEEADEMLSRSDAERQQENSTLMIVSPASSAGSDTNDSIFIVSPPPPVYEYIYPSSNTLSLSPSHMQPSHSLPSNTPSLATSYIQPSYDLLSNTQPTNTQTSNAQPANTQASNAQPANTQASNAQPANTQASNAQSSNAHTFIEDQRPNFIDPSQYKLQPVKKHTIKIYYDHFVKKC